MKILHMLRERLLFALAQQLAPYLGVDYRTSITHLAEAIRVLDTNDHELGTRIDHVNARVSEITPDVVKP